MNKMIAIASDHVGYDLKKKISKFLSEKQYEVTDFGCLTPERVDYPRYAQKVSLAVSRGKFPLGILICGTGVGMSIAANKVSGIRAVCCSEPYSAVMSRKHNNTNILTLGARVIGEEMALMIVGEWLKTEFEGGRHQERIQMIAEMEGEY